jgi:hypothetical protein
VDTPPYWVSRESSEIVFAIDSQLQKICLAAAPVPQISERRPRDFLSNESFWSAAGAELLRPGYRVKLMRFDVLEWFPRSPGLFHTRRAADLRRWALEKGRIDARDSELAIGVAARPPSVDSPNVIHSLDGKYAMLEGGYGCVRLRPQPTTDGDLWYFSASSNSVAHEGIPIGLSNEQYGRIIDEIAHCGKITVDIEGIITVTPTCLTPLYDDVPHIPQIFVRATEVLLQKPRSDQIPRASAAVSFRLNGPENELGEDGRDSAVAFVEFNPGANGNLRQRLDWLSGYVDQHTGTVVTDFDETVTRFPGAVFSLEKVVSGGLIRSEIMDLFEKSWIGDSIRNRYGSIESFTTELLEDQQRLHQTAAQSRAITESDSRRPGEEGSASGGHRRS